VIMPIPTPSVLDPGRSLTDKREAISEREDVSTSESLQRALNESCSYGQQLWQTLDAVRDYLTDSLPLDPRTPGDHTITSASPTGPTDDDGWNQWIDAYAAVTSTLVGPHGDAGYGLSEARNAANLRRSSPVLAVHAAHPANLNTAAPDRGEPARPGPIRTLATAALLLLALRGLRPRRILAERLPTSRGTGRS
jgi:hypothetical protein